MTAATAAGVVREDVEAILAACDPEFRRLAGRRLLITGGGGFLGYYLVQAALRWNEDAGPADRIEVTVFDNYARGIPKWLEDLRDPGLRVVRHDIREPLPEGLARQHFIVHAAGIASPTFYRLHPIETMDANVTGLRTLLEHATAGLEGDEPVEGFLFFSSSEIYGDPAPEAVPTPETYRGNVSCTGPRACYDESKRYGETLCVNFARHHGVPVTIARPFNNYGPGLKISDRRVIPDFARDVLAGRDIVLLSEGSDSRTFCYAADAVSGYYKVLLAGRPGEPYNIGTEEPEITMRELAERMTRIAGELFGYEGRIVRGTSGDPEYLTDNPSRRCPVIEKARTELGYEPKVTLDEGLARSLVWYRENPEQVEA